MGKKRKGRRKAEKSDVLNRVWTGVGIVLCVILLPVLIINVTLIVKSYVNQDEVPSVGGYLPMIVLTDSMYPEIQSGDLIICRRIAAGEVRAGDVISFFDPAGNGTSVVTHRVVECVEQDGGLAFRTKGDANNTEDAEAVPAANLVGVYQRRIAGAGNVAMFMQTTPGLIVCVIVPFLLLVLYDMIRRRAYEKGRQQDTEALLAELERLKAEKAQKTGTGTKEESF
ncbi:MAG: signal peptidase I [Eubacteriales bacterium]|nr:signal peptidase I [Eubacteriales bacterium]